MDEPLSALDTGLRVAMREEIQRIHRICGCTVFYVTHDQSEALAMSDRILIMNNGTIEQNSNSADIYYRPATSFVARFVSGSNLIAGNWRGDTFSFGTQDACQWFVPNVQKSIKQEGFCPLRPDQIGITLTPGGLPGIVRNVQFQGKDSHYTIGTSIGVLQAHISGSERYYKIGERDFVEPRNGARVKHKHQALTMESL
jgi:iron(III) transport system ATP-binding protein